MPSLLKVAAILERSLANGPGERFVVWTQGCALACPGCFNSQLWPQSGGLLMDTADLAERINALPGLRGVTLTGGEPLEQPDAVTALFSRLNRRLDTVIFTGFTKAEIASDPRRAPVLAHTDLIVAGRYEKEKASSENPWAGSSNKEILALTGRIRLDEGPEARVEAVIAADGSVMLTGFPSGQLKRELA
jgi:anaerobic ribonucleoside-triphosphate reductase activating protein